MTSTKHATGIKVEKATVQTSAITQLTCHLVVSWLQFQPDFIVPSDEVHVKKLAEFRFQCLENLSSCEEMVCLRKLPFITCLPDNSLLLI